MKEASIKIETSYPLELAKDFLEEKKLRAGTEIKIAKGTHLRYESCLLREAVGFPDILEFTLIVATYVALPIALDIAANWIYDKIRERRAKKIMVGSSEVEASVDEIRKLLKRELKEKAPRKRYFVSLSFPEFSQHEILLAARTLSHKPIVFDGNNLPYPDNMSYFGEYSSGNVEAIVYIRDEKINQLYEEEGYLYAKAEVDERRLPRLFFTKLILSSKPTLSGFKMKPIEGKEDMPSWF